MTNVAALSGLYTCDLICWGTASPPMFAEFIDWLGAKLGSKVVAFQHRAKDPAWEGTRPVALLADGRRVYGREVDLWQRLWYGKLCRPSCYRCGFHSTDRPGDVSIGDYWGLAEAHSGLAFGDGTSFLAVNGARGSDLVDACGGMLRLVPSEMGLAANDGQPMLLRPPVPEADKDRFWDVYYRQGFAAAAEAVGAIKRPTFMGFAKKAAKKVLRLLLVKGEENPQATNPDEGWKEAEVGKVGKHGDCEYPLVYAAKNSSDDVRKHSASGGMFHALAEAVIRQGGVVYGCAFDDGLAAVHIRCVTMEEAERCMRSKYSQSRMGDAIRDVSADLGAGRTVLFTGTPCEVAAVCKVCGKIAGGVLILADIICHGVPSPELFQLQLDYIARLRKSRVVSYEHRPKWNGWGHFERFTLEDGRTEQGTPLANSWKHLFYSNKMLRPSCYRCPYTSVKRESDLTIADFWGIEHSSRPELEDRLGVSLVLANTEAGDGLLKKMAADELVHVWPMRLSEALPGNPMLERPSTYEGERSEPWKLLYRDGFDKMMRVTGFHQSELKDIAHRAIRKGKRSAKRILGKGNR